MSKAEKNRDKKPTLRIGPIPVELISPAAGHESTNSISVLLFGLGEHLFAIGVDHTEGVVECPAVSPLPNPPEGMVGVASVRGRMTLVMDLSLDDKISTAKRRLILLKGDAQLGLLADSVDGVVTLEPKQLKEWSPESGRAKQGGAAPEHRWPATHIFRHLGHHVPIIDAEGIALM